MLCAPILGVYDGTADILPIGHSHGQQGRRNGFDLQANSHASSSPEIERLLLLVHSAGARRYRDCDEVVSGLSGLKAAYPDFDAAPRDHLCEDYLSDQRS